MVYCKSVCVFWLFLPGIYHCLESEKLDEDGYKPLVWHALDSGVCGSEVSLDSGRFNAHNVGGVP